MKISCWKCGAEFEAGEESSGRVIECPGCGARSLAMEGGPDGPKPGEGSDGFKCPTCGRRVRTGADECLNCGRPFGDQARLDEFLEQEPRIKSSLARTISEKPEAPAARGFGPWLVLLAIAAAAVAAAAAFVVLSD